MRYYPAFEEFVELARGNTVVPVYRQLVGDTVDGSVIAPSEPYEQIRVLVPREAAQHVLEISRTHLGRSARTGRVAGEADLLARLGIDQPRIGIHEVWT